MNSLMEMAITCLKVVQIWGVSSISPGEGKSGRHLCQNHLHQILITFQNAFCFQSSQPHFFSFFQCSPASFDSFTLLSACLMYKIPVNFYGFEVCCWMSAPGLEYILLQPLPNNTWKYFVLLIWNEPEL